MSVGRGRDECAHKALYLGAIVSGIRREDMCRQRGGGVFSPDFGERWNPEEAGEFASGQSIASGADATGPEDERREIGSHGIDAVEWHAHRDRSEQVSRIADRPFRVPCQTCGVELWILKNVSSRPISQSPCDFDRRHDGLEVPQMCREGHTLREDGVFRGLALLRRYYGLAV